MDKNQSKLDYRGSLATSALGVISATGASFSGQTYKMFGIIILAVIGRLGAEVYFRRHPLRQLTGGSAPHKGWSALGWLGALGAMIVIVVVPSELRHTVTLLCLSALALGAALSKLHTRRQLESRV